MTHFFAFARVGEDRIHNLLEQIKGEKRVVNKKTDSLTVTVFSLTEAYHRVSSCLISRVGIYITSLWWGHRVHDSDIRHLRVQGPDDLRADQPGDWIVLFLEMSGDRVCLVCLSGGGCPYGQYNIIKCPPGLPFWGNNTWWSALSSSQYIWLSAFWCPPAPLNHFTLPLKHPEPTTVLEHVLVFWKGGGGGNTDEVIEQGSTLVGVIQFNPPVFRWWFTSSFS